MKNILKISLILSIILIHYTYILNAEKGKDVGISMEYVWDARSFALGNAQVAIADDSYSYFANPAGLGFATYDCEFSCMYGPDIAESRLGSFNFLLAPGLLNYTIFNAGDIEVLEIGEDPKTINSQTDTCLSLGGGLAIKETLFIGTNLKFLSSKLAERHLSSTFLADLGFLYRTINDAVSIGIVAKNISDSKLKYYTKQESLPKDIIPGLCYRKAFTGGNSILFATDWSMTEKQIRFGIEQTIKGLLSLRAGFSSGENRDITCGFGIKIKSFRIDYGLQLFNFIDFGGGHRISLLWKFGTFKDFKRSIDYPEVKSQNYLERNMPNRAKLWNEISKKTGKIRVSTLVDAKSFIELPKIKKLLPSIGQVGTIVKIQGKNLNIYGENIDVLFDNIKADIIEVSTETIVVRVPKDLTTGSIRAYSVFIKTPDGNSNSEIFVVPASKLPLISISPLTLHDENGDNKISAGELAKTTFTVTNATDGGVALNLKIIPSFLEPNPGLNLDYLLNLGKLDPGKSISVEVPFESSISLKESISTFTVTVEASNLEKPVINTLSFQTLSFKPPNITIESIKIDDKIYPDKPERLSAGNGNLIIEPGESIEVYLKLTNKGKGPITSNSYIMITCSNPSVKILSDISKIKLGYFNPGEYKEIVFGFMLSSYDVSGRDLNFKIDIYDERLNYSQEIPFLLKQHTPYRK